MTALIAISCIIVYGCVGAVICGACDEFLYIQEYVLFWPFMVTAKLFKKWCGREEE